ncbi:tyrosine-type recombinase/integrase [Janthinobacterium sp. GB4P2]|uniref:tyrosine-type recombinase/integrase n=1 Tax=Janthinobacterium sp. GB4P2 TaxID=3424189 RepID=UPI003F2615EA
MEDNSPRSRAANTVYNKSLLWVTDPKTAFHHWLEEDAYEKGHNFSAKTIAVYTSMWAIFIAHLRTFRDKNVMLAGEEDIRHFLDQARVCKRVEARQRYALLLRRAYAALQQAVPDFLNPTEATFRPATPPADEKPMPFLFPTERASMFALLCDMNDPQDQENLVRIRAKAMCALMLGAGFKPGQANITSVNCVGHGHERFVFAPQCGTMTSHRALVHPAAWPAIDRWLALSRNEGLMFPGTPSDKEQPIDYARAFVGAKKLLADLGTMAGGERVSPQTLRNSYGASLLEDGLGLAAVQEYMGYSRLEFARRFSHAHAAWCRRSGLQQSTVESASSNDLDDAPPPSSESPKDASH